MELKIKKLKNDAILPKLAHETDACIDLYANSIEFLNCDNEVVTDVKAPLDPNISCGKKVEIYEEHEITNVRVHSGIAVEIPTGYVGLLFPRSSVYKTQYMMRNCVGVIDSGYRGEIMGTFGFYDCNLADFQLNERFAQLMIIKHETLELVESDELSESDRGEGGHGSSGRF